MVEISTSERLEERYVVLKLADIDAALSDEERTLLVKLSANVEAYRRRRGVTPLRAVVVEADWPEYSGVVASILARNRGELALVTPEIVERAEADLRRRKGDAC